jgi:hypothetical protein
MPGWSGKLSQLAAWTIRDPVMAVKRVNRPANDHPARVLASASFQTMM